MEGMDGYDEMRIGTETDICFMYTRMPANDRRGNGEGTGRASYIIIIILDVSFLVSFGSNLWFRVFLFFFGGGVKDMEVLEWIRIFQS